jgi:hypothetical protein
MAQRLRVVGKRIKVLYIEDPPRWEFRFLRWGLIRDRNMEAQTFLTSADPQFVQDHSPSVEPLATVPRTREELFEYHVIILGDVDPYDRELGEERLELIREFVEEGGGGLLVVAGQRHMPRSYVGTPLEALLPVEVDAEDLGLFSVGRAIETPFTPELTLDGRQNPLMRLENDLEENDRMWGRLAGFYWLYRPRAVKPLAQVLAQHPDLKTQKQQPVPVFAVQQVGAGLTFYSGTDEVWRWRAGVGDRYTYRFWGQVIRYLSTGRLLRSKRFAITTDRAVYDLGDPIEIRAEVNDRSLRPSEEETQDVFLEGPSGEVHRVTLTQPPRAKGQYKGRAVADRVGPYRLWIAAGPTPERPNPGDELAVRVFQVQVPEIEKADPKMDERLLTRMATATGGRYFPLAELAKLPGSVDAVYEVKDVRVAERTLWDRWEVLVALVAVLGVEWYLRKRWKMW